VEVSSDLLISPYLFAKSIYSHVTVDIIIPRKTWTEKCSLRSMEPIAPCEKSQ
jgi:hypothetical protein